MAAPKDLYEFLKEAELEDYYNGFKSNLKVNSVAQIKYVEEEDLADIGMSKPEIRRLKKFFKRECPQGALGRIKKVLSTAAEKQLGSLVSEKPAQYHAKPSGHIIAFDQLSILKTIGSGEFGTVQQGVWTNEEGEKIQVAIKCLTKDKLQTAMPEYLKEIAMMHSVDHEYIVQLYGVVLESDSLMMVNELAPLRSLLECLKEPALRNSFPVLTLCDFTSQVTGGMAYLENKRLIHRDLAARNILVFSRDKVKISDFGLSRAIGVGDDYYQCNYSKNLKLPIAWCAPECINYLRFTSASDVWAFGVTLWEMFTYGFQPWAALTSNQEGEESCRSVRDQILEAIDEPQCQRLDIPDCCPQQYYDLMLKCWKHSPDDRPTFNEITKYLPQLKPEQLQTTVDSAPNARPEFLHYRAHDLLTVLDKSSPLAPRSGLWRGVLEKNNHTGWIDPSETTPYVEIKTVSPMLRAKAKMSRRESGRKSLKQRASKISADMISRPKNDLRHTGHIGYDGAVFGDVAFIGNNYDKLPVKVGSPYKTIDGEAGSSVSLPRNLDAADALNPSRSELSLASSRMSGCSSTLGVSTISNAGSQNTLTDVSMLGDGDTVSRTNGRHSNDYDDTDFDLFGDFKMPDFSSTLDFGPSFMDEVMKALNEAGGESTGKAPQSNGIQPESPQALTPVESTPAFLNGGDDPSDITPNGDDTMMTGHWPEEESTLDSSMSSQSSHSLKSSPAVLPKDDSVGVGLGAGHEDWRYRDEDEMIPSMGRPYNRSSQDERELQEAIAIASVFAKQSAHSRPANMYDDNTTERPRGDSVCSDTSPTSRSRFGLRKRSPKSERSSYCDEIERRKSDISEDMTPEAQEAYNILVVAGTHDNPGRARDRSSSSRERRRQRSLEHQQGDSTIDRARNVNMNIREPQGIPLRRSVPSTDTEEEDTNPLRRLRASQGRIPPRTKPRPTSVESDTSARYDTVNGSSRNENIRRPNLAPRSQFKLATDSSDTVNNSDTQNSHVPLPPRKPLRPGSITNKPRERKYPLDLSGIDPVTRERTAPTSTELEAANAAAAAPALPKKQTSRTTTSEPNANVVTEQPTKGQFPSLVDPTQFCVKNVRSTALQMGFEDANDSFWTRKVNFEEFKFEGDSDVPTTIHYRTSDSVSYEDIMEYALDGNDQKRASRISRGARPRSGDSQISDEIRLMGKVLTKDVTLEDCMMGLEETKWDVHQAIKYLKLKQLLSAELADLDTCKWALVQCKWSVQEAANFLIANPPDQESPECVNV